MKSDHLRNIAIIAHVDHGKTTLVDKLLQQTNTLDRKNLSEERIMDSNDQEKEQQRMLGRCLIECELINGVI